MAQMKPPEDNARSASDVNTPGVSAVHGAVSDTIVAMGDAVSTAVHATGNVGEELVNTVGRVGRSGIREASSMLVGIAGGLREAFGALTGRQAAEPRHSPEERKSGT